MICSILFKISFRFGFLPHDNVAHWSMPSIFPGIGISAADNKVGNQSVTLNQSLETLCRNFIKLLYIRPTVRTDPSHGESFCCRENIR